MTNVCSHNYSMKFQNFLMQILCLIIGHNKYLEIERVNNSEQFFDVCSQCKKKWKNKDLTKSTTIQDMKINDSSQ